MRMRLLWPLVILAMLSTRLFSVGAETEWGPWLPLKDGNENGIKIAFKKFPNGTVRYKLRNDYLGSVSVHCSFQFKTTDGKSGKESGCDAKLAPGQEKTDAGWFDFGVSEVNYGSLAAKVSAASETLDSSGEFGAESPHNGSLHAPDQFQGLSLSGNPPADFGSNLQAGHHTSKYKDGGPYDVDLYVWQYYKTDAQQCPSGANSAQQFALFEQDAVDTINVKNGVITTSNIRRSSYFLKCIPASDTPQYPRWRPEIHFRTPGTAGIGDRG